MASKIVAVAGGTGKLGRAIVEELVAHGTYTVFILGREANEAKAKEIGAPILAVNYNDQKSLISVLESHKIDTIVSIVSTLAGADPELALIQAADASSVTKRYIPSTWGISYTAEVAQVFPLARGKLTALAALSSSNLEYTSVNVGIFLDYFGYPHLKSYLGPFPFVLDIAHNIAAIPLSGNVPVTFTYSFDIGRFVARLLGTSSWEKESIVIGDKVSWNEFLAIAEEVKGTKFEVKKDDMELLQQGKISELPSQTALYPFFPKEMLQDMAATFEILMEKGHFDFERKGSLNEKFEDVKTTSVRQLVEEAWRGR